MRSLILLLLLLPVTVVKADEWWAWTMLDMWHPPSWSAGVFMGNFLDTKDGARVQIVSPRLKYELLPWLQTGIGLSTLSIENTSTHYRYWQERFEFELNPKINITPNLLLENRNRMEWRLNEREAFTTNRIRDRLQLSWKLPEPVGPLTRLFVSNEWLFDLHRQNWTENRLVPLGLTFKLSSSTDIDVMYMIDSTRARKQSWVHESVLVTYLRVRF